ncbi:MAG: hypothetical protein KGL39_25205 [Patescibacteria group bacterium]|nr:hypothetical protein [Patescibacteria group bacterium]
MTDPREVAAGLTKAQRDDIAAGFLASKRLKAAGLTHCVETRAEFGWVFEKYDFTDLGRAVASLLKSQEQDK